jgi:hypothetical protein
LQKKQKFKIKREEGNVVSLMFVVSFSISSGSIDANPLARSQGQVKLDADKSKL